MPGGCEQSGKRKGPQFPAAGLQYIILCNQKCISHFISTNNCQQINSIQKETGKSAKDFIQGKIIDRAKNKIFVADKNVTGLTPNEYRSGI